MNGVITVTHDDASRRNIFYGQEVDIEAQRRLSEFQTR
jgi:hypothetical protein